MKNDFPILIPFKENSRRFKNKNFILFNYTYSWLSKLNLLDNVYVVTDSTSVKNFINANFNDVKTIDEQNEYESDDIVASCCAAKELKAEWYFQLPLTQPLRNQEIIQNILEQDYGKYDFLTTYQETIDRSLFYLNDACTKFQNKSNCRKGSLCQTKNMVDGSIYFVKTSFSNSCLSKDDNKSVNEKFWSGKFLAIKNDVPFFIDVDTEFDYGKFNMIRPIF